MDVCHRQHHERDSLLMADDAQARIIEENPIGSGLDPFLSSFNSICEARNLPCTSEAFNRLTQEGKLLGIILTISRLTSDFHTDIQNLTLDLLFALRNLSTTRILPSKTSHGTLQNDLRRLVSAVASETFDSSSVWPLLTAILARKSDSDIWCCVYDAVTEPTTPSRAIASSLQQTPWMHKTSSFANSSEYRQDVDRVLKTELGPLCVGLPHFHSTFFGRVSGLRSASNAVFKRCTEGKDALFTDGWKDWPKDANQEDVLSWFSDLSEKLAKFSKDYNPESTHLRRPLAQPNKPIQGSTAERKLDIGFVSDTNAGKDTQCQWSQILVPGELKSNPSADTTFKAWLDLGRYAREVLAAQDTRRFVLGFTMCGSFMRVWAFDRLGGLASERFDINEDGLQFVSTILGFLWMSEAECGFDPTITEKDGRRIIEIERNGQVERLILDRLLKRTPCIAGRATTCWKAHREDVPGVPLVVKDSWQYPERDEEGDLLQEATERGVVNVARYYHHATVSIRGKIDDVRDNVRGGLDVRTANNYRPERSVLSTSTSVADTPRKSRSRGRSGVKRSSSQTGASLPPNKRSCPVSPNKAVSSPLPNRVHRRVVLSDYGEPIYKASTRQTLLVALEGCITGHQSLQKAGILHRDISVNNLMINEDKENPETVLSGANKKTGTRAFMAIGALLGEKHTFMHDLESFFWVIFWICIHYEGPGKGRAVARFDKWNFVDTEELAGMKKGEISDEADFVRSANEYFTKYYRPLVPCVNNLRKAVFPSGRRWAKEDKGLYDRMKQSLRSARED
ncbi:hypothetical protein N7461_003135 [Penicillium sp. DV-2018c]|nr:hypothetical protein N7461_003135 [Penicillium sp. DV-2018c]